jgi:2-keto-4-pentenoate hydratase/2-oxohepta-3-ene-1,7-dioic acid hydratase in catechol pathway
MRVVTYDSERGPRAGVLVGERRVVDAWDALGGGGSSVRELLEGGLLADLADAIAANGPEPIEAPKLLPPVPDPQKIICVGLNYRAHAEEAGQEPPTSPAIFGKYQNALAAPGATVRLPRASEKVDYEAEVAVIIGAELTDAEPQEALAAVAGYTLLNDLSARDLQFATPQWMPGKIFAGSAPCGPALVTPDEAGPYDEIEFSLTLNGERMQHATTGDMIFPVPELVARLSQLTTLLPGDVIATGTPAGVGSTRQPRVWLKPGDEIVISSPQLGSLRTLIA